MADFGGFQVKTPQEVLAELAAQRQAIASMGGQQGQNANIQFQMANMFGNPELKKARKTEKMMNQVNSAVPPGGSLEDERKRLSMMFDVVKGDNPEAAAAISQQLVALDSEQFERGRLTAAADRSERSTAVQEAQMALQEKRFGREPDWSNYRFVIDPNNPKAQPKMLNISNAEEAAEFANATQNGLLGLTQEQAADMLGIDAVRQKMKEIVPKSAFNDRLKGYESQARFLDQGGKLVERFRVNDKTGLLTLDVARGIRNAAAEGKAIVSQFQSRDGSDFSEANTKSYISSALDDLVDNEGLRISETQRALYESSILNLGYVLARSLDSGGRLSDQDVNMAIKMLTGGSAIFEDGTISVPAEQIVSVMLDRAADINDLLGVDSVDEVIFSEDLAEQGNQQAVQMRDLRKLVRGKYANFTESAKKVLGEDGYNRVVDPYNQPSDDEVVEGRREKERQAERDSTANSNIRIIRPDKQIEERLVDNQGVLYTQDGNITIIESPEQLAEIIRTAGPQDKIRIRGSDGKMSNITPDRAR